LLIVIWESLRGDALDKSAWISLLSLGLNENGQNSRLPGREYPVNVRARNRVTAATDSSAILAIIRTGC
jgi:hypothetical protein